MSHQSCDASPSPGARRAPTSPEGRGEDRIHVVAAVLSDRDGRVLIAQRPSGKHSAGLWEFPGGKVEPGETAHAALSRELHEEIGVHVGAIEPLIGIPWDFATKSIFLDVYRVLDFAGEPHGREGQALAWHRIDELADIAMPPPDRPVVAALRLPTGYAITPEPASDDAAFHARMDAALANGVRLLQLRAKAVSASRLCALARAAQARVREAGAALVINSNLALARELDLDGVHLPASELMGLNDRPLPRSRWLAASCHDARELAHAASIGVDFAVLGPVLATRSHPGAAALGWRRFAELCAAAPLPVYALGGLAAADLPAAKAAGAQGIAGISAFFGA
ncbi:MAG: Nudix family hydrolase [Rudaea sp.]|uniref:Nudix family hydrolase n=1 Tax=Rudaea sp. TaxID=2136325 RepID=UPI0039E5280F